MQGNDDILELLREKGAQAARGARRGVILQPGAIGDCVLTLSLAAFMKECLELGGVDILGHTEYIGILPGRTCVNGVRSMDSVQLHRLFAEPKTFDLADGDALISVFADYAWIVTFLGEPGSSFEQNLIFTANCSHSAEVITLSMKPPETFSAHITDFYAQQIIEQSGLSSGRQRVRREKNLIRPTEADKRNGRELLKEIGVDFSGKLVVIAPGSGGLQKCWHLDNFLTVANELVLRGIEVIFLLGPSELERFSEAAIKSINEVARCVTGLSLVEVLGLLSSAGYYLGNDSGITHLSAGLGVRTLAVFGPTNPVVYGPIGPAVTVLTGGAKTFAGKSSLALQRKVLKVMTA